MATKDLFLIQKSKRIIKSYYIQRITKVKSVKNMRYQKIQTIIKYYRKCVFKKNLSNKVYSLKRSPINKNRSQLGDRRCGKPRCVPCLFSSSKTEQMSGQLIDKRTNVWLIR